MSNVVWQRVKKTSGFYILLGMSLAFAGVLGVKGEEVNAACAWGIRADITDDDGYRSFAACGFGESDDGSFKAEIISGEGGEKVQKITLKDYHGGSIYGEYCGSGGGGKTKAIIELVGENTITAEGGVGINLLMPVEFAGEGTLKITAMIPIGGGSFCGVCAELEGSECVATVGNQLNEFQAEQLKLTLGVHTLIIKPTIIEKEISKPVEDIPTTEVGDDKSGLDEDAKKCPDGAVIENNSEGWGVWDIVVMVYIGISALAFVGFAVQWFIKRRKMAGSKNAVSHDSENSADGSGDARGVL